MKSQPVARVVAAALIIAGGLVLLARRPSDSPQPVVRSEDVSQPAPSDVSPPPAVAERPTPSGDDLVAAKVRELEAMSETFRNTTFLIAIRDSGFVCNELLRVYGGIDTSAKWMVTCSEMHAYTVGVGGSGTLHVEPTLQYFDGLTPRIEQDTSVPAPRPELRLPPQPPR